MANHEKMSTGSNDRPKNASIAQTGPGPPDDSSAPITPSPEDEQAVRRALDTPSPRERLTREVDEEIKASARGSE
ncbi:hypothetical protein [Affinirhizobium pseudoryzae]|uniref:hypothetical protein n=1 Tax=Allorhizobium pseudoryzae TaxID=379684 RepID=UPI0013EB048D|nr:hypothetical protein [Allorhizobium pseudoryzae]